MKGLERILVWRDVVMMKKKEKVPMRRVVPRIGSVVGRRWKKRDVMRASDVRRDAVGRELVGEFGWRRSWWRRRRQW
jgi:hypothetical protein